jgi:hypothetical protein
VSTIAEWLASRTPVPPDALRARLAELLAPVASHDACEAADACLTAAHELLGRLLSDDCATRQSALDLLAADALVTYAFEAAADDPSRLSSRANDAMVRIASLTEAGPA